VSAEPWEPPTLPPEAHVTDDGETVFLGNTPAGPRYEPTPRLAAEVEAWKLPATAAFPLHPLGVAELFDRARQLLRGTAAVEGRSDEEQQALAAYVWRSSLALFRPGRPIRARVEEFVSTAAYLPPNLDELGATRARAAKRLALASAWAVVRAATEWSQEAA
jgi:hypothetical protein